ncbi:hypothetical protein, partial [Acetobacter aceti]|uniref:hypothetical protein n=1 Tax=Acetobacter aceti TaxID=435 RepID=UPI001C609C6D
EWARRLADQDIPEAAILRGNLDAALSIVAERSPMRRDRLLDWGALSPQEGNGINSSTRGKPEKL